MKSNQQPTTPKVYKFIEQTELYKIIDEQVRNWLGNPSNHYKIEKAKIEGYFGTIFDRDYKGLIGYLRMNFGKQIKILNKLDNYLPIFDARFVEYFRSNWFADRVLEASCINHSLVLEKHFQLLKN